MDKKTRKNSLCEKVPYIAVILSIAIPALVVGVGGSLGEQVSSNAGNIGNCCMNWS